MRKSIFTLSLVLLSMSFIAKTDIALAQNNRPQNYDTIVKEDRAIRVALECPDTNGKTVWKTATRQFWDDEGQPQFPKQSSAAAAEQFLYKKFAPYSTTVAKKLIADYRTVMAQTEWRTDIEIQGALFGVPPTVGNCKTHIWWIAEHKYITKPLMGRADILSKLDPLEVMTVLLEFERWNGSRLPLVLSTPLPLTLKDFLTDSYKIGDNMRIFYKGFDVNSVKTWIDDNNPGFFTGTLADQSWPPFEVEKNQTYSPALFDVHFNNQFQLKKVNTAWKVIPALDLNDPNKGRLNVPAHNGDFIYGSNGQLRLASSYPMTNILRAQAKLERNGEYTLSIITDHQNRPIAEWSYKEIEINKNWFACPGLVIFHSNGKIKSGFALDRLNDTTKYGCYDSKKTFIEASSDGKIISKIEVKYLETAAKLYVSYDESETIIFSNKIIQRVINLMTENDQPKCQIKKVNINSMTLPANCWAIVQVITSPAPENK